MKIHPGHFDALSTACNFVIASYGKDKLVAEYEDGKFARADKVKDLTMRFCFDVLHAANVPELINEIYEYANDSHIFTALKRICPTVERKY